MSQSKWAGAEPPTVDRHGPEVPSPMSPDYVIDGDPIVDAITRVLDDEHIQCGDIGWDGRVPLARKIAARIREVGT